MTIQAQQIKCPECEKQSITPERIYTEPHSLTTDMAWYPYYDSENRYHDHNPNKISREYHCSNGHSFSGTQVNTCWCGWSNT
jgi:hypothetical protein